MAYEKLIDGMTHSFSRMSVYDSCPYEYYLEYLEEKLPEDTTLWVGAVDSYLNQHKYIVPGLGDAGDLAFGEKE